MQLTCLRIRNFILLYLMAVACLPACKSPDRKPGNAGKAAAPDSANTSPSFGKDIAFLESHVKTIVLRDSTSASAIIIVPAWQGRVMTSTLAGDTARGNGWINYDLISSRQGQPHINAYGGEERLWLGPEGGQNGFFFRPGDPFDLEHWQTPAPLDTLPFTVLERTKTAVSLKQDMQLVNYKGIVFNMQVTRTVTLIARKDIRNYLGIELPKNVKAVAYHSCNTLSNTGQTRWDTAQGLPSVWILGMFPASEKTTVIIPYQNKKQEKKVLTDRYFGEVPADRLSIGENLIYFKADARYRSKIGLKQAYSYNYLGSYDAGRQLLTLVQFSMPESPFLYANSTWELQRRPFDGDVLNAYNDGPVQDSTGSRQLGNFYELESSSPALRLRPGAHQEHYHRTFHISGPQRQLNKIVEHVFGIGLKDIPFK
jgi:hypothetical protein